jgi:hypothetical protein
MKHTIQQESEISIGERLNINTCQQIMITITQRYLGPTAGFEIDDDKDEVTENKNGYW